MTVALITSKGQTTIPKKIRSHLRINAGDKVDFVIDADGRVFLEPATVDVGELEGMLHRPGMKPVSDVEIKNALKKRFSKDLPS